MDLNWRRLDNSAKLFPIMSNKKFSSVFRISAILYEEINEDILKIATENAVNKFISYKVKLKKGFFWYYLEYNSKDIIIEEENNYPCKYIDKNTNNEYLFKVTYYKNKINLDVFHSLTDGTNAMHFLKEIVYCYLEISHKDEIIKNSRADRIYDNNTEDDYIKNYNKHLKNRKKNKKAYILRGKKLPLGAIAVTHVIMDLEKLRKLCKTKDCTITQYLTAILIESIFYGNYEKSKRPIKICIPVNLKKYFSSKTISNFFSYITVEINKNDIKTFSTILEYVKKEFKEKLTEDGILKTMSANVKLGTNIFIRLMPLFLKKFTVKLSYIEIRKYTTTTYSNIGKIGILPEYKKYIDDFFILIAPEKAEKIKCSSCSYENNMSFTFTSILQDKNIEKKFIEHLKKDGIFIKTENNGV